MSDRTAIEWTDASWNPIRARRTLPNGKEKIGWHCTHASEGCRHCYADAINRRLGTELPYKPGLLRTASRPDAEVEIFLDENALRIPLHWRKPREIFPGSMTDLFADFVTDEMLDRIFAVMGLCQNHIFQPLTKRPERARRYLETIAEAFYRKPESLDERFGGICVDLTNSPCAAGAFEELEWPLPNVWLGTSIEDRPALLERAGHLRQAPAAVRWFSMEPLIGDPGAILLDAIDWVVVGGESGNRARHLHPFWVYSIRDQCLEAGIAFFFKQWGAWAPKLPGDSDDGLHQWVSWRPDASRFGPHEPGDVLMVRRGKKASGRLLDGRTHDQKPRLAA